MLGTSSHSTPAPGGTSQTHSTCRVVSSPTSSIAHTPTPLCGVENLPDPIPKPETRAIITNPPQTWASERYQRQRQWQLPMQAVFTPRSMVSGSRSIDRFGHWDMTSLLFATGRLLEVIMWNRWPSMSSSDLEKVRYGMRLVAKALVEAPHGQMIEKYWNTAMQQNNIWSVVQWRVLK